MVSVYKDLDLLDDISELRRTYCVYWRRIRHIEDMVCAVDGVEVGVECLGDVLSTIVVDGLVV